MSSGGEMAVRRSGAAAVTEWRPPASSIDVDGGRWRKAISASRVTAAIAAFDANDRRLNHFGLSGNRPFSNDIDKSGVVVTVDVSKARRQ